MLPPVQTASRSTLAFADSASETAASLTAANVAAEASHDPVAQADGNSSANASAVAGRINNLLLNSRSAVRADMATIADMVGSSINITRLPGESDGALAARFVTALAHLSDSQRTALQSQLNQVLKGLQVQVLLQVLQNQEGPEAALLSAYMEIQRSKSDNLKAQTVVASYSQNADTLPEEQSGQSLLTTPRSAVGAPATAPVTPQSSITIALQASIAGAKDKEEAIAKLAAALRQASSANGTDETTEAQLTSSATRLTSTEDESAPKSAQRGTTMANAEISTRTSTDTGKSVSQDLPSVSNSAKAAQDMSARTAQNAPVTTQAATSTPSPTAMGVETATAQAKQTTAQAAPFAAQLQPSSHPAGMIDQPSRNAALFLETDAALTQASKMGAEQQTETTATVVSTPVASQQQAVPSAEPSIDNATIVATVLAAGGLISPAILAPQGQAAVQAAPDSTLLRQMFFQNGETQEAAEVEALRALASQPESPQDADTDNSTKAVLSKESQQEQQGAEKAASRTPTALTLAAAQTMATAPVPPHIMPPLGVPLLVGNYLAMQDPPNTGTSDISVDAVDALNDEEPRRDGSRQNAKRDQSAPNETAEEADPEEDGLYAISDTVEPDPDAVFNEVETAPQTEGLAALTAPQDEPVRADMLYWKIADLA